MRALAGAATTGSVVSRPDTTAPAIALTLVLVLGSAAVLIALMATLVAPRAASFNGLAYPQRQGAETVLFLTTFGVLLPLGVALGPKVARAVDPGVLPALASVLAASLALALLAARLGSALGPQGLVPIALVAWAGVAGTVIGAAVRGGPPPAALARVSAARIWPAAGVLWVAALLAVADLDELSVPALVGGALVAAAIAAASTRVSLPPAHGRWGVAADLAVAVLIALAVADLVGLEADAAAPTPADQITTAVLQFHADFLLGPANQLIGGGAMLVDTSSQYGVGSIYFLAGWFELLSIGHGTLTLFDSVFTALFFVSGYALLRLAGASRPLAALALGIGVVVLALNREYPVGTLLQEGPLRFGLPMLVVLALTAGARFDRRRTCTAAAAIVVGLSSIWAFEAFAYTVATYAAMTAFELWLAPPATRRALVLRRAAQAGAACVAVHVLLALITLVAAGELPAWGEYLSLLKAFLAGDLGEVTYDFSRWAPALAVGAGYLTGAVALVTLMRLRPDLARRERVALLALTGVTTYGIACFSYFVNRSADHVLPYVSFQALLAAALWLSLARRGGSRMAPAAGALAVAASVLLVAVAWPTAGDRFDRSALGHVLPGGDSPRAALDRLRDFPPIDPRAPAGERLLARFMPDRDRVPVVVAPALATEILVRSGRTNQLRIADAVGESYVTKPRLPVVRDAIDDLRAGDRMLVDEAALRALEVVRRDPGFDPLDSPAPDPATERLQAFALREIDRRFRLRPIHRDRDGFVVVELEPRG